MLDELSPRALNLIRTGATLGLSFQLHEVAEAMDIKVASLLAPLEEAVRSGILTADAKAIRFQDAQARADLLLSLPESVRLSLDIEARQYLVSRDSIEKRARIPQPAGAVEAARQLLTAGYFDEAIELATKLVVADIGLEATNAFRELLAHSLLLRGDAGAALTHLLAMHAQSSHLPPDKLAILRADCLLTLWFHDNAAARRDADRLIRANVELFSDAERGVAHLICAFDAWASGQLRMALACGRIAVLAIAGCSHVNLVVWVRTLAGHLLSSLGLQQEAQVTVGRARVLVEERGGTLYLPLLAAISALIQLRDSASEEAQTEARSAVSLATNFGQALITPFAYTALARMELLRNRPEAASSAVKQAESSLTKLSSGIDMATMEWVAALTKLEQARRKRDLHVGLLRHELRVLALEPAIGPLVVRSALEAGEVEIALEVARQLQVLAEHSPDIGSVAAAYSHVDGLLRKKPSGLAEAALRHTDALARRLATQDLDEMVVNPAVGPVLPRSRMASLTPAERRVAEGAAAGLTNQQLARRLGISPHTVNFHLRGVFRKLGVSSRVEVARLVEPSGDL